MGIDIFQDTFVLHFIKLCINSVDQFLIMAYIAVFPGHQRKILCLQIIQMILPDHILGLITKADHGIILSSSQIFHGLRQVVDNHNIGPTLLQSILYRSGLHHGHFEPLDLTQSIVFLLALSCHHLIIQTKHGTRIGHLLPIGRENHHAKIHLTTQDIPSYGCPFIGFISHGDIQALHQQLGECHISAIWQATLIHELQRRIILIDAKNKRF